MNKKVIDDIVWYIPFKKLRNALREYLLNISNNIESILYNNITLQNANDKKHHTYYKLNKNYYYKLNFGPGPNFIKPDPSWINIDMDNNIGDVVMNFNEIQELPFEDGSVECIYASHVFEHMSIYAAPKVFKECYRVLKDGGVLRIIIPDIKKAIKKYLENDYSHEAFIDNKYIAKSLLGIEDYTIFEALKAELISPSSQNLYGIAHQNGWDFEALVMELKRVGFNPNQIVESVFQKSQYNFFNFEGKYESTANKYKRSLYVEATK
ncbi:class I SAM-dependent methyltransferase [Brachyspira hampsonii]|uniref:Methyltransferase type 11 domain-containing protein n=1 Tax=Brachyspira hampsonii TaxID=1287055 RepID=A0AAC9TSA3_9SPIR|nr:methyltransferase domain-containing protein [Brachyspira hampsonii]ASJ20182.1 hypothetical protein BHAMNSH16_00340 [Brachyspira hampsonii]ELV04617.1 hypothetical protein H263_15177 [Brachyspira hampsonii 30599]OEJ17010.1 hypothetical protein A9496_11925 [Brachyspira hampsonii]